MKDDHSLPRRTQDEVYQLIADALGIPLQRLSSTSVAQEFPEWDSMGILIILAALNRDGLQIDIGEATALQSVAGILNMYQSAGRLE